jgi:exopolyphosphatase/guanosine-5'-triphosphate,3'-diphosphate pyrophosphatase
LIEAARDAGGSEHRFGEHGDELHGWLSPLFHDDSPAMARIRRASCLLADVAWQASPDFRADRGVEMALHGDWIGVTASERVMMAQALSSSFGRERLRETAMAALCAPAQLERARHWGLAMRLGQRMSGGVGSALKGSELALEGGTVQLRIRRSEAALVGDPVHRRLAKLAAALNREPDVLIV